MKLLKEIRLAAGVPQAEPEKFASTVSESLTSTASASEVNAPAIISSGCDTDLAARGANKRLGVHEDATEENVGGRREGVGVDENVDVSTGSEAKVSPRKIIGKRPARPSKEEPDSKKARSGKNQSAAGNMGEVKTSAAPKKKVRTSATPKKKVKTSAAPKAKVTKEKVEAEKIPKTSAAPKEKATKEKNPTAWKKTSC